MSETNSKTYVVGITRFSLLLPNASFWNLSNSAETPESYARRLYDPARLNARLKIFSEISLPQLAAQTVSTNYRHVVQYSTSLPDYCQEALKDLTSTYPFLRVQCSDDEAVHASTVVESFRDMVPSARRQDARLGWFRLDDDDVVSTKYFERILPYVEGEPPGRVVSLGLGYSMIYHKEQLWDVRADYRPKNSIGQLYICAFDDSGERLIEPPRQNHAQIDKWAPTILDSRSASFITVVHPLQDGRVRLTYDDAIAAVDAEQAAKPIERVDRLESEFSAVLGSGHIADYDQVRLNDRAVGRATGLSTDPVEFDVALQGDLAVEISVRADSPQTEGRVILGFEFAPGTRPKAVGRWVEVDANTLAIGFVVTTVDMTFRAHMFGLAESHRLTRVRAWVSRSFDGDVQMCALNIANAHHSNAVCV
ncbi:glycosyltransferase [Brevibacterium casei]|uniref:Rhamnosyl transferase n=1 Tax=Brevibacterium casei CIP 102111 TaxID=1255625 RepID=A0A2H1JJG5_9MICO|nr:glycosyltransferase [Brevibacterium casei]QPR39210.1 hypothetical protein I6G94_17035 [Brevibacterium casei]QPR43376.1 hypothetical protein I6G93_14680 [Brevibacterium casei]SMX87609.1 Putative rhamnosyl transferase [Brevibacterium casei CIP 102111]